MKKKEEDNFGKKIKKEKTWRMEKKNKQTCRE